MRRRSSTCAAVTLAFTAAGCTGMRVVVKQPALTPAAATQKFKAGAAEIDITPHPGPPLWGHSTEGKPRAKGYRMRLKARAIAFEDKDARRCVLVQLDLGASSGLVHREVAAEVADLGLDPSRVMFAATHTHGGPGGIYGSRLYNHWASSNPGFDRKLQKWVTARIVRCIEQAFKNLHPATLYIGGTREAEVSRNRSPEAWGANFEDPHATFYPEKDKRLRVLRIHTDDGTGDKAVAAIVSFAVHATAVSHDAEVFHPDLHGVAARALRARINKDLVAAFINSAEGDISPNWVKQDWSDAERLGETLAQAAYRAYSEAKEVTDPLPIKVGYRELVLPGAKVGTQGESVCDKGMLGKGLMAGAEDGRPDFYGKRGIVEGARHKTPKGCQGHKVQGLGFLQNLLLRQSDFVRVVPFHILRFGDVIAFAGLPAEPTTVLGRQVEAVVGKGIAHTLVVGLADEYNGYWTTSAEYALQHYEGASTVFGPNVGRLAVQEMERLAADLKLDFEEEREFFPGFNRELRGPERTCADDRWKAGETEIERDPQTSRLLSLSFDWQGARDAEDCDALPTVSVWCDGAALKAPDGLPEDDTATRFEVRREGDDEWEARWAPHEKTIDAHPAAKCRLRVERPRNAPLYSDEHVLKP